MKPEYIALLAGFVGALVGGGFSVLTIYIQLKSEAKKERLRLASELAVKGYQSHVDIAVGRGGVVPPLAAYLMFNVDLLDALYKGKIDKPTLEKIYDSNKEISELISGKTRA